VSGEHTLKLNFDVKTEQILHGNSKKQAIIVGLLTQLIKIELNL